MKGSHNPNVSGQMAECKFSCNLSTLIEYPKTLSVVMALCYGYLNVSSWSRKWRGCESHSVQSLYLYVDLLEAQTGSFVFNTIATCQGEMGDGGRMVHDDEIRGC